MLTTIALGHVGTVQLKLDGPPEKQELTYLIHLLKTSLDLSPISNQTESIDDDKKRATIYVPASHYGCGLRRQLWPSYPPYY